MNANALPNEMNQDLRRYRQAQSRRGKAAARYAAAAAADRDRWTLLRSEGNEERVAALEEAALLFCGDDPLACQRGLRLLLEGLTDTERSALVPMMPMPWKRAGGPHLWEYRADGLAATIFHNPFHTAGRDDERYEWRVAHDSGPTLIGRIGSEREAKQMAEIAILRPYIN